MKSWNWALVPAWWISSAKKKPSIAFRLRSTSVPPRSPVSPRSEADAPRKRSRICSTPRACPIVQRLRKDFDTVLIDTPPVLHISDARVLGRMADAVILVLKAGQTTRDAILMAKQKFVEDGTPLMGTILNNWNPKQAGYGYKHYDGYYYQPKPSEALERE